MGFSENLMRLRKENGLSQEQLGNEINVTRQTISKWELGDTVPDMNKLIELSKLFNISVDELIGNNDYNNNTNNKKNYNNFGINPGYEYISERTIQGMPLVHINVGHGIKKAKGIIAIGNFAEGVIAIGGFSLGIVSIGGIGAGLVTLSGLSFGLLLAIGGLAVGYIALGGFSLGVLAIGGGAIGIYALGGAAIAKNIAYGGGYASGHIAIGDKSRGAICFITKDGHANFTPEDIRRAILNEFPETWKVIVSLFSNAHLYNN